jgi:hydroxypyruvate reductase
MESKDRPVVSLEDRVLEIWRAGLNGVRSETLVEQSLKRRGNILYVNGRAFDLSQVGKLAVVGAGKAGAGMAAAVERVLGPELLISKVVGCVNVPADCIRPLKRIRLHAARPAGVNEPTQAGVEGSEEILRLVSSLSASDLCLVLLSGGGSALLPAPRPPITLDEKRDVTRFLMKAGATIHQLNAVRTRLSRIKGGGLARACGADRMITLIISDVVGDPLDVIASGPTCRHASEHAGSALEILLRFGARPPEVSQRVLDFLREVDPHEEQPLATEVFHVVIGNNGTALSAAADCAVDLGYRVLSYGSENRGEADEVGAALARHCRELRPGVAATGQPLCILSGGEPVVDLMRSKSVGKGGRNQQVVLAALMHLWNDGMDQIAIISGGTDGEDGPTDAAGACAGANLLKQARHKGLHPQPYLENHDAYHFFKPLGGLVTTGPTHTNVMDLRVALIGDPQDRSGAVH